MKKIAYINNDNTVVNVILIEEPLNEIFLNSIINKDANINSIVWKALTPEEENMPIGPGAKYIEEKLYPAKPFNSWIWNDEFKKWGAPTSYPLDDKIYYWSEDDLEWKEI
jgi:hypothetical protein